METLRIFQQQSHEIEMNSCLFWNADWQTVIVIGFMRVVVWTNFVDVQFDLRQKTGLD